MIVTSKGLLSLKVDTVYTWVDLQREREREREMASYLLKVALPQGRGL